jgi:DNA polymerase-4
MRRILHIDLDAFFCAVEELQNPALRGKPFAVGGRPEQRGVVASCSYAARVFGVRSAMPMGRALRLCPALIIVPGRHGVYGELSDQVMERVKALGPLIEQISIDEAFLDLSDLPDDSLAIARQLQEQIKTELGLPSSIGVAANKLVAKIANDVGKAARRGSSPPFAITIVPPGQEAAFLAPLPVESLWGVGPKTAARLAELSIHTIGELAACPESELTRRFGKNGFDLARHARGIDDSPLVTFHEARSISQETTFARDLSDPRLLRQELKEMSEQVGRRLRAAHLSGRTVKLKLRWPDFTTLTRQASFESPLDGDLAIFQAAATLLDKHLPPGQPVRLLGVGVSGLAHPARQLSLWENTDASSLASSARERRLQEAIDALRQRFGETIVQRGLPDD